ncbi:uncharacterized protein LOC106662059 [Cimex lectularius]|uniref:Uncharacterized protein n=1 Tax=Cimex lectularius TaxID=79782 RepID=A0A8I6R8R0_CIMLE|nr:uncharacterized protein LOC106662059 [Cimex lectularius]
MGAACLLLALLLCIGATEASGLQDGETERTVVGFVAKGDDEVADKQRSISEARGKQKKGQMMRVLMIVKMIAASFIIPSLVAMALFASWKGITISLLAFTIALVAGIKNLTANKKTEKSIQHVIVSKAPSLHEHWWRKLGSNGFHHDEHPSDYNELSPYREYYRNL